MDFKQNETIQKKVQDREKKFKENQSDKKVTSGQDALFQESYVWQGISIPS